MYDNLVGKVPSIDRTLLNKQVYEVILDLIIKDQLKPGMKLSAIKLSQELNVGRSPVSEALKALERDGFLQIVPQSGTFVKEYSAAELDLIYRARIALESLVMEQATLYAERKQLLDYRKRFESFEKLEHFGREDQLAMFELDVELHNYFAEFIIEVIRKEFLNICNLTKRSRLLALNYSSEKHDIKKFIHDNVTTHIEIIDAMLKKDVEKSIKIAIDDIIQTKDSFIEFSY